jgi:hypothetical protein
MKTASPWRHFGKLSPARAWVIAIVLIGAGCETPQTPDTSALIVNRFGSPVVVTLTDANGMEASMFIPDKSVMEQKNPPIRFVRRIGVVSGGKVVGAMRGDKVTDAVGRAGGPTQAAIVIEPNGVEIVRRSTVPEIDASHN